MTCLPDDYSLSSSIEVIWEQKKVKLKFGLHLTSSPRLKCIRLSMMRGIVNLKSRENKRRVNDFFFKSKYELVIIRLDSVFLSAPTHFLFTFLKWFKLLSSFFLNANQTSVLLVFSIDICMRRKKKKIKPTNKMT